MSKGVLIRLTLSLLLTLLTLLPFEGRTQSLETPELSGYSYYPPSKDKESWQRLNLWLSSTFIFVAKEALTDQDSCLKVASRYLGLSRFSILAEGLGDIDLFQQSKWIDREDPAAGIRLLSKTTGKKHLQILLLLGSYYAFEPASYYHYRDSVEYFLNKAVAESKILKEDKLSRIAFCLLGKIYLQAHENKGDSIYNFLIDQCRKMGDAETEARAIAYRGMYTAPTPNTFQRKIDDLKQASEQFHKLGNIEGEINLLVDLGYMFHAMGQLQITYNFYLKAKSLADSIRYPYTHYLSAALATISNFQGKFGEPLKYSLQTIKVAERCRDSLAWSYFYSRMANLLILEGRQVAGVEMTQKAVDRFVIDRNPSVYAILNNIVNYMRDQGRAKEALELVQVISKQVDPPTSVLDQFFYNYILSSCYLNLHEMDSAETHIKKMDSLETIAENVRGPLRRTLVNDLFAHVFYGRGQYQLAREYIEKHFTISSFAQRTLADDLESYRFMINIDSALGDKTAMIAHYKEYTNLLDSNFRITKIRQAEELQVVYETQEKENQIAALNKQAKQTKLIKNLTLGGIAAVIIIAALLYRQNRLKQKSNKIITSQNEQLQDLVSDKEWLLKEVHHRVKNNLQIIMSLLDSQSIYIDDDAALTAINDSQRRVQVISLIHQKLYQSENTSSIDMPQYIDELVSYLYESFDTGNRIVIGQDIEPVNLDIVKAIPLGLIINESIVNTVKYAFPGEQKGIVRIGLKYDGPEYLLLSISDNGIGLPSGMEVFRQHSLGFSLMQGLARQLDGTFNIESNKGLHISVRFSALNNVNHD